MPSKLCESNYKDIVNVLIQIWTNLFKSKFQIWNGLWNVKIALGYLRNGLFQIKYRIWNFVFLGYSDLKNQWFWLNGFLKKYQRGDPLGRQGVKSLRKKRHTPSPPPKSAPERNSYTILKDVETSLKIYGKVHLSTFCNNCRTNFLFFLI